MATMQTQTPNLWDLAGGGTHVRYSNLALVGPAGGPKFLFQQGVTIVQASGNEIRLVEIPDLGTIVSITVHLTIDTGSTTFSVLLPVTSIIQSGPASSVPISTEGVTTHHAGPLGPSLFHPGQHEFYTITALRGTASHVLVA